MSIRNLRKFSILSIFVALLFAVPAMAQQAPRPKIEPVLPGDNFPAASFENFNTQAGGPEAIDLGASLGKRAVVLVYWVAQHPRADEMLGQVQEMYAKLPKDKVAIFGVAITRPGREKPQIVKRLSELGVQFPVLNDANFILGQQLRVQSVPNLTIIDKDGKLQLTNGASLLQVIGYEQTVRSAVERVAKTGEVGSFGYLDHYYPVNELVGKECPDFKAPLLSNSVEQRWTSMVKKDKVNVLIFWSVNCPHCRNELPVINAWLREHPENKLNVVSVAGIPDATTKARTKEYCDLNKFVFPTLVDKDLSISQLYKVTSTPTILFVGPNGVIDSVMLSASESFSARATAKVKELLGS